MWLVAAFSRFVRLLSNISIRNFIIIDQLDLGFDKLFSALTGETGTGKSIIIDAIDFCFGKFSTKNIKKTADKETVVSLSFTLKEPIKITKTIGKDDKTVVTVNDKQVSSKVVRDLYKDLIDITSQFDSILDRSSHLKILDNFMISKNSETKDKLSQIQKLYMEIQDANKKIAELEENIRNINRDRTYYSEVVADLGTLNIQANEETELLAKRAEISKLYACNNSIKSVMETVQSLPIESKLNLSVKSLEKIDNEKVINIKGRLESLSIEMADIIQELYILRDELFVSEEELLRIDDRLSAIRSIARKYNTSSGVLFEFLEAAKEKLCLANNLNQELESASRHLEAIIEEYKNTSRDIHKQRSTSAKELSAEVCSRLSELLMPNATFKIEIVYDEHRISSCGQDEIEFLANFNKKEDLMSFTQIASGGEAARLNFALKTVVGIFGKSETIIFDEVDIGIGGAAAYALGQAMRKLSEDHKMQVISITHSPQVASNANSHIVIKKEISNGEIRVYAKQLGFDDRIQEIARMISGASITEDAISAARQLIVGK